MTGSGRLGARHPSQGPDAQSRPEGDRMRKTTNRPGMPTAALVSAALLALLAACTEPQKPVVQCEPGVGDLSGAATLAPGSC